VDVPVAGNFQCFVVQPVLYLAEDENSFCSSPRIFDRSRLHDDGLDRRRGHILDPVNLLLAFYMFLWQVPHFWLLLMTHSEQYRKAGFPVVNDHFSLPQQKRIITVWLIASLLSVVLLVRFGVIQQSTIRNGVLFFNLAALLVFLYLSFY